MLLFYPWIDEVNNLKGSHETYEAMYKSIQRFVDNKARPYEHYAEELQRAQKQAEHDQTHFDEIAPGLNLRIWKKGQLILYYIYLLILIVHQNTRPSI